MRRRPLDGMDCGTATVDFAVSPEATDGGVTVHSTETVGSFVATIVSSTDPTAFETWLTDNGYRPDAAQIAAFTPLVTDGWFFSCMKLVPGTPVPANGWNTSVDPVELTFASDEVVLPLDALAINASAVPGIGLYVVDDHRMTVPGFSTAYANRISASEMQAITERYPTLAPYLAEGRTLTYLSRFFAPGDLTGTAVLERAATDDEVRTGRNAGTVPGDVVMLLGLVLGLAWRSARGRRRAAVSATA